MKIEKKYLVMSFLLLFGAQLLCASNGAEADSSKSKYALNDPRNPNCPCHKYQKEADKEYAKLQQRSGDKNFEARAKGNSFGEVKKVKRARTFKWFAGSSKKRGNKTANKKCFKDKLSRCFHF